MSLHPDVLIVGGGVIGLTAAYFLAREGLRVEVVDKGDLGQESSWAGAGILSPSLVAHARTPLELLRAQSFAAFPLLSAELHERTGVDNGFLKCGGLEFQANASADDDEWHGHGVPVETLTEESACLLEPALGPRLGSALHIPDMAQIRNPRHLKALGAAARGLGVRMRPSCPVHGWHTQGDRIVCARTLDGPLYADRVVLCGGAWTDFLLDELEFKPQIRPIRGQIVLLNTAVRILRRILVVGARYLVPRGDGRILIGSTEEDVGFCKNTTAAAVGELLSFAVAMSPKLADAVIEKSWAGLRPGSPDGLPFIGAIPGFRNAYVAAGHFRAGIQLSPGTAQALTQLILGQPVTVPLEAFRLDRPSAMGR